MPSPRITSEAELAALLEGAPYRFVRRLGHGGMAEVFLCEHTELGRAAVLKLLHGHYVDELQVVERMRLEARSLARLQHRHIVAITDCRAATDGRPYIVMEYLRGLTLRETLRADKPLAIGAAVEFARQALRALRAAHALGIVHRDIKPENLFLADQPDGSRLLKVLDFGLARIMPGVSSQSPAPLALPTGTGQVVGTAHYASPEGALGRAVDHRADLYALGLVLYEMLCGRGPFHHFRSSLGRHGRLLVLATRQLRASVRAKCASISWRSDAARRWHLGFGRILMKSPSRSWFGSLVAFVSCAGVAGGIASSGCASSADDCLSTSTCSPSAGAAGASSVGGSSSGESGKGGASAKGGASSNGGESGTSGTSGNSGAAGESGVSGAAGAAGEGGGGPCDTSKTPTSEACLVSDDYGVFVAPTGADSAAGTLAAPFATLSKAIAIAAAGGKFVVVCDATYDEHVVASTGAHVYGGFTCAGGKWASETGAPLFKPSNAGPALKVDTVTNDLVIEGVNFEVPDATSAGASAIAAIVTASPAVTLRKVGLTAGKGVNGADGVLQSFTYPISLDGNSEVAGGGEKDCACQTGLMSVGGLGGSPSSSGQSGAMGLPDHGGGQPGTPGSCATTGTGRDGSDAPAATPASGAATIGTIMSTSWKPTAGADGANGSPGQGGGGGASRTSLGHGGGGGCGGCGGNGAKGGQGGGASIALLALNSPVTLDGCALTSKDAGNGGAGHVGQAGQSIVGVGGTTLSVLNSCSGGVGGKGGNGAASGGGAGGISVGVLWKGATAPTTTNTTTLTGKAGTKGIGGVPGTNDGIDGKKQDVLQAP